MRSPEERRDKPGEDLLLGTGVPTDQETDAFPSPDRRAGHPRRPRIRARDFRCRRRHGNGQGQHLTRSGRPAVLDSTLVNLATARPGTRSNWCARATAGWAAFPTRRTGRCHCGQGPPAPVEPRSLRPSPTPTARDDALFVRGVVLLNDRGRNSAALGDVQALGARPVANL